MIQIGTTETDESVSLPSDPPTVLPLLTVSACVLAMQSFDEHAPIRVSPGRTKPPVPLLSRHPSHYGGSLFHASFLLLHGTRLICLHCLTFPAEPPPNPPTPPHPTHTQIFYAFSEAKSKGRAQGF